MTVTAGLDIGGSKISAVLLNDSGDIIASTLEPTVASQPDDICALAEQVTEKLISSTPAGSLDALGVGMAGIVDNSRGTVAYGVNIPTGNRPLAIGSRLEDYFQAPVNIENDANASAFGHYSKLGVQEGIESLVYLSIGTGISAGIVLEGQIYRGSRGFAGEIGHLSIISGGPKCGCGLQGCLEMVASGRAIDRLWPVAGNRYSVPELFAACQANPQAVAIVNTVADCIVHAVYLLALVLDVEVFVLGGGVTEVGAPFFRALEVKLQQMEQSSSLVKSMDLCNRMRPSSGNQIGAIGAAAAAADRRARALHAEFAA